MLSVKGDVNVTLLSKFSARKLFYSVLLISVIITLLYFIPVKQSFLVALNAIELRTGHMASKEISLSIDGTLLNYRLRDDILHCEIQVDSKTTDTTEHYTFTGSVKNFDDIFFSFSPEYDKNLNRYIPFAIAYCYNPFRIAIAFNNSYILAPANTLDEANILSKLFNEYLGKE